MRGVGGQAVGFVYHSRSAARPRIVSQADEVNGGSGRDKAIRDKLLDVLVSVEVVSP